MSLDTSGVWETAVCEDQIRTWKTWSHGPYLYVSIYEYLLNVSCAKSARFSNITTVVQVWNFRDFAPTS